MESKFYICLHETCPFETAKRKAIYTHLVRTHNERKEDYECEYCSTVFEDETLVENHLVTCHPDQQFTYTCVSRIENVINQCSKLGANRNCHENKTQLKTANGNAASGRNMTESADTMKNADNKNSQSAGPSRTKASVNESLNNLAARNQITNEGEILSPTGSDVCDDMEGDTTQLISKPGGLKMKLNLKKIAECSPKILSKEDYSSPPKLEPASSPSEFDSDVASSSPPDILPYQGPDGVSIREKASKYFDRLEVYHTTDEHGRRCCPFCPYKTSKNTIRVHLSGIHKIYFVKCSLCEYKAAFPHQVTHHGIKFHKTTNLNVIQLSKESRERTILQLSNSKKSDQMTESNQSYNYSLNSYSNENSADTDLFEEYMSDASSVISGDDEQEPEGTHNGSAHEQRTFKPPKSQMAKTDYFHIKVVNDVHLYCCNLCTFTTPVRATIYTHKYRHEEKTYKCDYCDFTAAPRSNVVHHVRTKHKNRAIFVSVVNDQGVAMETDTGISSDIPDLPDGILERTNTQDYMGSMETQSLNHDNNQDHPTIIKVPQYKRTLTSVSGGNDVETDGLAKRRKIESEDYKLSLNKLYKVNPSGSPKYVCVECSYGCDTHPKMKHHLYRHRPQQYKCPYCDHRKYPRSYVVRHVRDTHRDKPVRVIDLSVGPDPIDIPEYMEENENDEDSAVPNESMDGLNESGLNSDQGDSFYEQTMPEINHSEFSTTAQDTNTNEKPYNDNRDCVQVKVEPEDPDDVEQDRLSDSLNSTTSIINNLNQTPTLNSNFLDDTNDVSPNFSEAVYTSTPLIESLINGKFPDNCSPNETKPVQRTSVFRKKSMKEYRINYGDGPKYICNICNYGTENYKTIHNHMYRHESQKFQCPYCGYRRSPKSFVENHIREVHRGHPLFVTELKEDLEHKVPLGSPRQCVMNLKKKEQTSQQSIALNKRLKDELNLPNPSKLQIKWPAPKPSTQLGLTVPNISGSSLQIPVRQKAPNAVVVPGIPSPLQGNRLYDSGTNAIASLLPPNVAPFKPSGVTNVVPRCATNGNEVNMKSNVKTPSPNQGPFKFKEPSRTTYKTMYKCVFDPESCNHISKDKSKMKQHLFMHVEYKPWACDLCDMTASQSSHIKNHVRTEHYGVSDMSFKYKKHNYLEKHIDTFLGKGLFTVPVNEYRMIMDMKGNTKASYRTSFIRDSEGFVLCPHCDYKTKSASMTDHVKMKHMQPRFKCHWCTFKAFYRSEIRRHHKKEKSHANLVFRIQELDLKEVVEGFVEGNSNEHSGYVDQRNSLGESYDSDEPADLDDDDDEDDASSNEDLSEFIEYSTGKVNTSLVQKMNSSNTGHARFLTVPGAKSRHVDGFKDTNNINHEYLANIGKLHTEVTGNGTMKLDITGYAKTAKITPDAKFKCGYCSFSAALRVKVKMHCGKKHPGKELRVIEPIETAPVENHSKDNIMRVNCSELKGTKIEADLKRAGVSKLNLASLFPSYTKSNRQTGCSNQTIDEDSDDDDDEVGENDVQLTIPFKKADESMKIDISLTNLPNNKKKDMDTESKFKKPMDPVSINTSKFSDKKRDIIKNTKVEEQFMVTTDLKESLTDEENTILVPSGKEIVVEPMGDNGTDIVHGDTYPGIDSIKTSEPLEMTSENQCELQTQNMKDLSDYNSNVTNPNHQEVFSENASEDTPEICTESDSISANQSGKTAVMVTKDSKEIVCGGSTDSSEEEKKMENNQSTEDVSEDINAESETSIAIPALEMEMANELFKPEDNLDRRDLEGDSTCGDKISDVCGSTETQTIENSQPSNDNINDSVNDINSAEIIGHNLVNTIVHKTFPRGSPVVLEMDNDENDQVTSDNLMDISEDIVDDELKDNQNKEDMNEMPEN